MQYNNPDAPQQQVAYSDQPDPRLQQPQQPLAATSSAGGSAMPGTTTGYTTTRYEEKDPEAQQQMYDNPATMTTTTATTRQTVRPSPTHDAAVPTKITISTQQQQQQRSGGGFIGNFATRSRGGFFFPLHAAIVFFSFLVLVSAALIEDRAPALGNRRFVQYALVVGQISFAVSLGSCVMERLGLLNNRHLRVALSAFQVFFWMPALVLLTFFGVFISPLVSANGFFGAWGALTASAVAFSHESERSQRNPRKSAAPRTSLFLLFFTSLMIMGAGIRLYNDQRGAFDLPDAAPWSYTVFSIAFGAITAFLSVMFLIALDMTPPKAMISFGTFLWMWVAVGILVITFADPFEQAVGNGYYASLFALLSSFGLLVSLRRNERDSDVPRSGDATTGGAGGPTTTATGGTNNVQATTDAAGNTTYTTTTATRANQPPVRRESETSATFFLFVRGGTFASLVVLIAACMTCREVGGCQGNIQRFQIAAGAVSLGLGLIVVLLEAFGLYRIHSIFKIAFAFFWLLWWVACFIVLTFFGSFQSPALTLTFFANGFFFTWVALIFAALAFAEALKERGQLSNPPSHHVAKTGYLLLIVIGSAIELGAAIKWYYDTDFSQLSKYALALGSASIGLVLILYFILLCARKNVDAHDSTYNAGLYFLTVWWAVGALVLTYEGFWSSAIDNGYFSVFFTLGACLLALSGMWKRDDDDEYDDDNQYNYRNQEGTATRAYQ